MNNDPKKEKSINEMSAEELQAGINAVLQAQQSGSAPATPAVSAKDADPRGERLMRLPANQFSADDCKSLQSEISRVLKEGW
jgi:hypothetical protein